MIIKLEAAEAAVHANYPVCAALLLVEIDGASEDVAWAITQVQAMSERCGAREIRTARLETERALLWKGRKAAFAAMGRISPNYIVQDGVIPRTALSRVLREIEQLSRAARLRVANVFHAGDGNLHPLVLYDRSVAGEEHRAEELAGEILKICVRAGGSITGEHGVGEEKKNYMPMMFAEPDLATMQLVRRAFDPYSLSNPGKIFPRPRSAPSRAVNTVRTRWRRRASLNTFDRPSNDD
ncbi:MAG: FAD-linked oxidase C-terminal domain-containing protein [Pyrinomonadaceae bacterium]